MERGLLLFFLLFMSGQTDAETVSCHKIISVLAPIVELHDKFER